MSKQISHRSHGFLACFSPPVMIATFVLEMTMATYVIVRYKMSQTGRLILALLLNLAIFQVAEYYVCTDSTIAVLASRFGYAAITFLPPLAFYLMSQLTHPLPKKVAIAMFVATAGLVCYFLLSPTAFSDYQCTGNYVIFQIGHTPTIIYSVFYFGLIVASLWRGARFIANYKKENAKVLLPVYWLITGYLIFISPVAVLVVLHPDSRQAVPSLMCGFAVGMAIILTAKVAPLSLKNRR